MNGEKNSHHKTISQQYVSHLGISKNIAFHYLNPFPFSKKEGDKEFLEIPSYQYLQKNFSNKTAFLFLDKLEDRIELISIHPTIGKQSTRKKNVRSVLLTPHNILFYRYQKNKIEILCLFDMRKNPDKKIY